jgi:hypothetical protein
MAANITNTDQEGGPTAERPDLDVLNSDMAIQASSLLNYGQPVHETLTIAALINSDLNSILRRPTNR